MKHLSVLFQVFGIRFLIIVEINCPPLSLCKISGTPSLYNNFNSSMQM